MKPSHKTAIYALSTDTLISRALTNAQSKTGTSKRGIKQAITRLSRGSRHRMQLTLNNLPEMPYMATLTYDLSQRDELDARTIKRHQGNLRKWLSKRGIGGFWALEFTKAGMPHFALLLTAAPDLEQLKAAWHKITGSTNTDHIWQGVYLEKAQTAETSRNYLVKKAGDPQKTAPEQFQAGLGRLWGYWGVVIEPRKTVVEDQAAAAPKIRFIRNFVNARNCTARALLPPGAPVPRHLRPIRDNGRTSFVAWGTGEAVARYLHWLDRQQELEASTA